eukprot:357241-Chlamydomonas_euryale.AAC.5
MHLWAPIQGRDGGGASERAPVGTYPRMRMVMVAPQNVHLWAPTRDALPAESLPARQVWPLPPTRLQIMSDPDVNINVPLLLASATVAFALNMAVFLLIGKTSALTMNIAGVVKVRRPACMS